MRLLGGWNALVDREPIVQVDHALHLVHGTLGADFLAQRGADWGYDPGFMAGYVKTPFHDPSCGLAEIAVLTQRTLFPSETPAQAYKWLVSLSVFSAPLLWWAALAGFGASPAQTAFGVALAACCYWMEFTLPLLESGLVSFVFACSLAPAVLATYRHWTIKPTWPSWTAFAGLLALSSFAHPTMAVMLGPPLALATFVAAFGRQWLQVGGSLFAATIAFAANSFWILPFVRLLPYRRPGYTFLLGPNDAAYFIAYYADCWRTHPLPLLLAALGAIGLVASRRWLLGAAALWMFFLTFFGSVDVFAALKSLEPMRYQVPLHLWCALLAAFALGKVRVTIAAVAVITAFGFAPTLSTELKRYRERLAELRPLPRGLPAEASALVDRLERERGDFRVLFEDQLRVLEPTIAESLHWSPLLPTLLPGMQFIGGQYNETPLLHHHAAFGDFTLGGRKIDSLSQGEIADFLSRYNIGLAVCWSPRSVAILSALPQLERVGTLPRPTSRRTENVWHLFRVRQPAGWAAVGSARLRAAQTDRLSFADLRPEGGKVVLRFHWMPGGTATPAVPLTPVWLGDDPVPFIGVETSEVLPELEIFNRAWLPPTVPVRR